MIELVSYITTVKNGEKTIESSIDSILDQTYKHIEIIIIDDGSTDSTIDILKKIEHKDARIKVFYTGGIGRVNALNLAISKTVGAFIAILDADDIIHKDKTIKQVNILNNNKNIFLISTETLIFYNNELPHWSKEPEKSTIKYVDNKLLYRNTINHSSVIMRKEQLLKIGCYNLNQKSQVDYELWLRAQNEKLEMAILSEKLTAKRIHDNQSFENKKRLIYTYRSMLLQLKYISKNPRYWYYTFLVIPNFLFAQLPFQLRRKIRELY